MFKIYLRESFAYVVDHFSIESKRHFNAALPFMVCAIVGTFVVSVIFVILGSYMAGYRDVFSGTVFWDQLFGDGKLNDKLWEMGGAISILCLGLYSSFVISAINDSRLDTKESYTFKDFMQFIPLEEWVTFFILVLVIVICQLAGFKALYSGFHYDKFDPASYDPHLSQPLMGSLLHWIDRIIYAVNRNIPYLFAALFVVTLYEKKVTRQVLKQYRPTLFASVFLIFSFNNAGAILMGYVYTVVVGFVIAVTPTSDLMLVPRGIKLLIYIVIGAYYLWALSALLCLPIKLYAEREEPADEEPAVESLV
jgi:hypothetical protein